MAFEKLEKEKQNKIINAACEIFARHGYRKASMQDIAETAEVSKSVLFKYFITKENLYQMLFRLASDSITEADTLARASAGNDTDLFSLMKRSARNRLALFTQYPWIYKFAYTAAFDTDPFVKDLSRKELERYRQTQAALSNEQHRENNPNTDIMKEYQGLRKDISPIAARTLIHWVSQGYLEDRLNSNNIDPEALEQGFEGWIDILEKLLKEELTDEPNKNEYFNEY
jgi:AcrR family transcriptional regulator